MTRSSLLTTLVVLGLIGFGVFWFVTRPNALPGDALAGLDGDPARGEVVFWAGGCAACHAAAEAKDEQRLVLSGGRSFPSDFGTFYAPNISSDTEYGIGNWSDLDLANAMIRGVSPEGAHYYPAFPYTSYLRATLQDVVDLRAFLATLPASDAANRPHDVAFPFNIRRVLGGWKALFMRESWIVADDLDPQETRGRYLAEALGHCGECHTPRNPLGGLKVAEWLAGAPDPSGKGRIPNITPGALDWSLRDIQEYFTSGFTPEFDVAGGHMVDVIANLKNLPDQDRAAIAAYLKRVPASR